MMSDKTVDRWTFKSMVITMGMSELSEKVVLKIAL